MQIINRWESPADDHWKLRVSSLKINEYLDKQLKKWEELHKFLLLCLSKTLKKSNFCKL